MTKGEPALVSQVGALRPRGRRFSLVVVLCGRAEAVERRVRSVVVVVVVVRNFIVFVGLLVEWRSWRRDWVAGGCSDVFGRDVWGFCFFLEI